MREIIFRGKRTDNGEWVEGYLTPRPSAIQYGAHYSPWFIDVPPSDPDDSGGFYNVERETVGQFTGLADINGTRIFEGDIVKTHYANAKKADFVELVVFHNGKYCGMAKLQGNGRIFAPLADGVPHDPRDYSVYMDRAEVIGNIHDNPELLNEREDAGE